MEQSTKKRSEIWEQIYKVVKTLPRAECNGMDAPDAPSVTTELEELFLKLLPISHVIKSACETCGKDVDYLFCGKYCYYCYTDMV
ncbi:MAG: hypothetical protein ACOCVF_03875 [bacterium]